MNRITITGFITKDVEIMTTANNTSISKFNVAVKRDFENANGERETDFISCVAWRKLADLVNQYCKKGSRVLVSGSLQTRSYEAQDGTKRYATEIIADKVEFLGAKQETEKVEQIEDDGTLPF